MCVCWQGSGWLAAIQFSWIEEPRMSLLWAEWQRSMEGDYSANPALQIGRSANRQPETHKLSALAKQPTPQRTTSLLWPMLAGVGCPSSGCQSSGLLAIRVTHWQRSAHAHWAHSRLEPLRLAPQVAHLRAKRLAHCVVRAKHSLIV